MKFGENLRNLRKQRGYTQDKLAQALGTSQAAITGYEVGTREPSFTTIQRIADFFGVPMSALMPSEDLVDDEVRRMADALHKNPKLRLLFDRSEYLSDSDLDAVLAVVGAIAKERESF